MSVAPLAADERRSARRQTPGPLLRGPDVACLCARRRRPRPLYVNGPSTSSRAGLRPAADVLTAGGCGGCWGLPACCRAGGTGFPAGRPWPIQRRGLGFGRDPIAAYCGLLRLTAAYCCLLLLLQLSAAYYGSLRLIEACCSAALGRECDVSAAARTWG